MNQMTMAALIRLPNYPCFKGLRNISVLGISVVNSQIWGITTRNPNERLIYRIGGRNIVLHLPDVLPQTSHTLSFQEDTTAWISG